MPGSVLCLCLISVLKSRLLPLLPPSRGGACDDKMPATLTVDKHVISGLKAYESRCTECTNVNHPFSPRPSARFNGWCTYISSSQKLL